MVTSAPPTFVQIGATRDGLDPYLDCARGHGLRAVLVETPAYLRWRALLGRPRFDHDLPVDHPEDTDRVVAALRAAGVAHPVLVLTGFERYVRTGFAVAAALGIGDPFVPPDKLGQRAALTEFAPQVRQPRYVGLNGTDGGDFGLLDFPQVVKPADGGGGLGVLRVENARQRSQALGQVRSTRNYGGGSFTGLLVEEFVDGAELSAQGVAIDGTPLILSVCEKLVVPEPVSKAAGPCGFREAGHIASHGSAASPALTALVVACLAATGYRQGPFHVDAIRTGGGVYFVEMGFRLSGGGLTTLVERVTGLGWAELVFAGLLDRTRPVLSRPRGLPMSAGQVTITGEDRQAAEALLRSGAPAEIQWFAPPPALAEMPAAERAQLASDRLRHGGAAGRVVTWGGHADEIRGRLERCIASRLRAWPCAG